MAEPTAEWTQAPERGADWAMRSLLFALNILGYTVGRIFLIPIAAYFVITGGRSRRASREYLARLHALDRSAPKPTLFQVYLHHLEFAHVLMERALLWQGKTDKFQFSGHGKELLESSGKLGSVLLGAHFGSFDALRILAKEMNCRVNVVMYRAHAQKINKLLEDLNPDTNVQVIEMTPGDTEGVLKLKQCIERGLHQFNGIGRWGGRDVCLQLRPACEPVLERDQALGVREFRRHTPRRAARRTARLRQRAEPRDRFGVVLAVGAQQRLRLVLQMFNAGTRGKIRGHEASFCVARRPH